MKRRSRKENASKGKLSRVDVEPIGSNGKPYVPASFSSSLSALRAALLSRSAFCPTGVAQCCSAAAQPHLSFCPLVRKTLWKCSSIRASKGADREMAWKSPAVMER